MSASTNAHHILPTAIASQFAVLIGTWTGSSFKKNAGYNLTPLSTSAAGATANGPPYDMRSFLKDDELAASAAALDGPDIWRDAAVMNCFFVSDRLKRAMEDAKIKPVNFLACALV